ncbi:hypothetical protein [uncultured Treponema sp.]|uniref:hypothetical protein n=1 Tax=uncultured Treponema sp. TaxID=162155 RepID=UPI002586D41B|nr:hypothetical protein [uncultured Treponema sp.]
MFKASKLIKNLIFLLLFIPSVSARAEGQSLSEPQKPGQSQEIQSPSQEIPPLQQKQKISFFNSQNFNFKEKRIFSLDTAYLLSGLKNNGWGLGLSYEQLVIPFLSVKGDFSHTTIFPTRYDATITTVGISLNTFYYPFNKGLNFLYIGFGCRTDFLMYSGDDVPSDHKKDSLIRLAPQIGWKQSIYDYVLVDIYYSYRFSVLSNDLPNFVTDITNNGNGFGVKLKFNLQKIFKAVFRK